MSSRLTSQVPLFVERIRAEEPAMRLARELRETGISQSR